MAIFCLGHVAALVCLIVPFAVLILSREVFLFCRGGLVSEELGRRKEEREEAGGGSDGTTAVAVRSPCVVLPPPRLFFFLRGGFF